MIKNFSHIIFSVGMMIFTLGSAVHAKETSTRDSAVLLELIQQSLLQGEPIGIEKQLSEFLGEPSGVKIPYSSSNLLSQGERNARNTKFYADVLKRVGLFIQTHAQSFPNGLPSFSSLKHPERLGPLFESLTNSPRHHATLRQTVGPLNALIPPDWLDAAKQADAWLWLHMIRCSRGEMQTMLSEYQNASDDTGIIMLGELLGIYPELIDRIHPQSFDTRTLAHFLAAAMSEANLELDGVFPVIMKLDEWEKNRAGLTQKVTKLVSHKHVVDWCNVVKLFRAGQREESVRLLSTLPTVYQEQLCRKSIAIQLVDSLEKEDQRLRARVLRMMLSKDCPQEELPALARAMPIHLLIRTVETMLSYDTRNVDELWYGTLLLLELANREDKQANHREELRFHQSDIERVTKLFLQAKQDDRADVGRKAMENFTN